VHLACGIWGTLAVGLFASGDFGIPTGTGADNTVPVEGLFYGGGTGQLVAQAIGNLSAMAVVAVLGFGVMFAIRRIPGSFNLRIAEEHELAGIDEYLHGLPAYHMEFGSGVSYSAYSGAADASGTVAPTRSEGEKV
jgi:Amt family ammonium transporter